MESEWEEYEVSVIDENEEPNRVEKEIIKVEPIKEAKPENVIQMKHFVAPNLFTNSV